MKEPKLIVRLFGVVWITIIISLAFLTVKNFQESGMAISFLFFSAGMTYCHFSGMFDPSCDSTDSTTQHH